MGRTIATEDEAAMTPSASRRLQQFALVLIAVLGLTFGAARVAHAFTFSSANGVSADGSANLQDPDEQFGSTNSNGQSTVHMGDGVSMQFGAGNPQSSFDSEYNSSVERLFNPNGSPGR
jgi:hypothetical protein